jgi:hypothetical protein
LLSIEPARRERITAIKSAVQRAPIVLVLGMHRSGTSLCSHVLSALGIDMADKISNPGATSPHPSNPRGHWERWEIVEFHDRILGLFNRDYLGCFHDFALPVAWWADPRVAQIRREIIAFLQQRMGDGYFGFKDPRTVRLLPMWHQIFSELKLAPRLVLCLRNPAQVARSLHARDGVDPVNGEYRWLVHMIDFYRYTSNFDYCTVEYEAWFSNPAANIDKLFKFLELPWQQSESDLTLLLSDLIDRTARHDDLAHSDVSQPLVRTLYKLASQAGQETAARDQIAYIVSQFVSFQQLQKPLLQAFEDFAKIAVKYPEIEQEVSALRAAISDSKMAAEAAYARAADAEGRLAQALLEFDRQRVQIDELAKERDESRSLKGTLIDREAAFTELSQQAEELRAALQVALAEGGAREAALQDAEREAQKGAAAAEASQREIAAQLRSTVAKAEASAQERAAALAARESEIAQLRSTVAKAEHQAQQRGAAAEAMQGQIVVLQSALTIARQVGSAAIAALRIETAAPTKPGAQSGWRQAIMRLFGSQTSF